jgi:hypothetical protein
MMNTGYSEAKAIANALYEIRQLLSPYLGSENDAPMDVRLAAHIAYAFHNEALALAAGDGFDVESALKKVAAIDGILHVDDGSRIAQSLSLKSSVGT